MKIRYLLVSAIFLTLFFVVVNFPASYVLNQLKIKGLTIGRITGTVWDMNLSQVKFKQTELDLIKLRPSFSTFFKRQFLGTFDINKGKSNINGDIISYSQNYQSGELSDINAIINIAEIIAILTKKYQFFMPITIDGDLAANIPKVSWKNARPFEANGSLKISNITAGGAKIKGILTVNIERIKTGLKMTIDASKDSELQLKTTIMLNDNRQYHITGVARLKNTASLTLINIASLLGVNKEYDKQISYIGKF